MKLKKIIASLFIIVLVFLCLHPHKVQANFFTDSWGEEENSNIEETIDKDDGGLFEKIIAKLIRRISRNNI